MWLYNIYKKNKICKSVIAFTFICFTVPVIIIFIPYIINRINYLTLYDVQTVISLLLAGSWAFLGPLFIILYFVSVNVFRNNILSYYEKIKGEDNQEERINEIFDNEMLLSRKRQRIICLLWLILVISILLVFNKRLEDFAIFGFSDIYYWVVILFVSYLLYLQSIGFSGLITTHRIIKHLSSNDKIVWAVLNGSSQDGVEVFGSFLIKTTIYFFSGIVFFPILIIFAKSQGQVLTFLMILLMVIFTVSILIFFLSTYISINRYAVTKKNSKIEEIKIKYNDDLIGDFTDEETDVEAQILRELRIANNYRYIEKLRQINTNPIHLSKVIITIFTVIFPIMFFLQDFYELIVYFFRIK